MKGREKVHDCKDRGVRKLSLATQRHGDSLGDRQTMSLLVSYLGGGKEVGIPGKGLRLLCKLQGSPVVCSPDSLRSAAASVLPGGPELHRARAQEERAAFWE